MAAVAAVEAVGDAQERCQPPHDDTLVGRQPLELGVPVLGRRAPVIARDGRDQLALAVGEAGQIGVVQQVVGVLVVAVVGDERTHVVQHRCRMQERALLFAEPVQLAGLIEERQRELRHLLGVLLAVSAAAAEGAQAVEDRRLLVQVRAPPPHRAADEVGHQPVAQAARGDVQLLDAQLAHHPFADGGAGIDDVVALLVDAELAPLFRGRIAQPFENAPHLRVADREARDRFATGEPPRQLRHRAGRARGPDDALVHADQQRVDLRQAVLDGLVDQLGLLARDRVGRDEELGQPHRTELHADGRLGLLATRRDNLGRAAADVEDQRSLRSRLALQHAEADEARLLGAADHLETESGVVLHRAKQGGAVRRFADRAGGDGADPLGAGPLRELGETLHRESRPGDGRGREPAGAEDLLAEANRGAVFGQDRRPSAAVDRRDLQARRVRSEIDDGQRGALHGSITKSWIDGMSGSTSTGRRE